MCRRDDRSDTSSGPYDRDSTWTYFDIDYVLQYVGQLTMRNFSISRECAKSGAKSRDQISKSSVVSSRSTFPVDVVESRDCLAFVASRLSLPGELRVRTPKKKRRKSELMFVPIR